MPQDITAQTVAAAAQVVSGKDNPNDLALAGRPNRALIWAMVGAGPVVAGMTMFALWMLGFQPMPDTATPRVHGIVMLGMALAFVLGVVVLRYASGQFRGSDLKIGAASLHVSDGQDQPPPS